jgi:hypothetical protein
LSKSTLRTLSSLTFAFAQAASGANAIGPADA